MSEQAERSVAWVCFAVAMADGYDTLLLAFIAPLISKDWQLAPVQIGQLFAISYAGAALGAFVTGFAADRWGRRKLLYISLAVAGIATVSCSLAQDVNQLMALRCIAGIGLGGAIPAISAITAAAARPDARAAAVTRMFLGYPIGALVGGTLTGALMTFAGWRGVFLGAGIAMSCLIPLVRLGVPESSGGVSQSGDSHMQSVALVFGRRYIVGTMLLCISTFSVLLVTYFLVSWTPTVLTFGGLPASKAALATVSLNLGGLIGAYLLSGYMEQRSAPVIVGACLVVGSVSTVVLGQSISMAATAAFACAFAAGVFVIGAQSNLPALTVRFYPASAHATGVGLSMSCGRIGSILGPLIAGYLASAHIGWPQLYATAAVPALIAGGAVSALIWATERPES